MDDLSTDAAVVAELAQIAQGAQRTEPTSKPYVVLPESHKVEQIEKFLTRPTRLRGTTVAHDLDSFIRYTLAVNLGELKLAATTTPST